MTISRRAFACAAGAGFASLIVPGLPEKYRNSRNAWLETAKIFNQISGKVKLQGMRVGYYNHPTEFGPTDGEPLGTRSSRTPTGRWSCSWTSATRYTVVRTLSRG